MRRRKLITVALTTIILIVGIASVVLYKLGDRIFNEVIDSQITEIEQAMEQTQVSATAPGTTSPDSQQGAASGANTPAATAAPQNNNQNPSTQQPNGTIQVTKDKLEEIKESVTPSDKMAAATLVLSKLSQSDINRLTKLAADGISPAEKEEMKAIVYSKFTQAEINKIRDMYYKYMK